MIRYPTSCSRSTKRVVAAVAVAGRAASSLTPNADGVTAALEASPFDVAEGEMDRIFTAALEASPFDVAEGEMDRIFALDMR